MTSADLIVMFNNLSKSLPSVQEFLGGFSYVFGLVFCLAALVKLKAMLDEPGGHQRHVVPASYFMVGVGLLFLPSLVDSFSSTLFGAQDSVLAYTANKQYDIYQSITILVQTIGFVWFIRGCVLLSHSSQPQHGEEGNKGVGPKGLFFIIGGLFAINFYSTTSMLDYIVNHIMQIFGGHQA